MLAIATLGYAVVNPPEGEEYTDFHILTESEEGDLVADGYPDEIVLGESADIVIGVSNHERSSEEYTVVVQLQVVGTEDTEVRVHERHDLDRVQHTLGHDQTQYQKHSLEPKMVGENLRVVYLQYLGDAPADPTREDAYRDLHIWINGVESE